MTYSHRKIEQKWQKLWFQKQLFSPDLDDLKKPKLYLLDMFPYPSGSGLHVGHLRGYLATDVLTRMKMMQGFNVFHPIGFDSFGLPAEQYAILTKKDPLPFTEKNIAYFVQQLKNFGFAYDYQRIICTHDPHYYQWTQWIFLRLWQKKLAFLAETEVNYCPALNTVLANEEIINLDGKMVSERGEHPVFRQQRKQWMLGITHYAQRLLSGLEQLDWPEGIKKAQVNWIDQKEGFICRWLVVDSDNFYLEIPLFKLSDLINVDFIVLQINNQILDHILSQSILIKLKKLRDQFSQKVILSSEHLDKKPVGLFTKLLVVHPFLQKKIPIFFAEYVSHYYSYGIKLGMPKLNVQDWFFAKEHQILHLSELKVAQQGDVDCHKNELIAQTHQQRLEKNKQLFKSLFYGLRDWVFARQRYWGEPFPVRHLHHRIKPLSEDELPLRLPAFADLELFLDRPETTPLASIAKWVNAGYDINTMPQWAGSCWYFLAYLLKKTDGTFWPLNSNQARTILNRWMPIDLYVGGAEHAVLHLLYARFWNLFLTDLGCYDKPEPFQKLRNPGLILASDGKKMSKSKNNFVDPNSFLLSHGADALRLYEKFLGPFDKIVVWNERGLDAMRKWLARVYRLFVEKKHLFKKMATPHLDHLYAVTVQKVSENYDNLSFNVAVSQLMVFINHCYKSKNINFDYGIGFLKLLHPICPHLTEEIWFLWAQKDLLVNSQWPIYNPLHLKSENSIFALQINGKTKKTLSLASNVSKNNIIALAKTKLFSQLQNIKVKKIIFVPNKIVNFVL